MAEYPFEFQVLDLCCHIVNLSIFIDSDMYIYIHRKMSLKLLVSYLFTILDYKTVHSSHLYWI